MVRILLFILTSLCIACSDGNLTKGFKKEIWEDEAVTLDEKQLLHRVNRPFKGDLVEIREDSFLF